MKEKKPLVQWGGKGQGGDEGRKGENSVKKMKRPWVSDGVESWAGTSREEK